MNENIEDEHHVLFMCPAYDGIRKTWLKDIDYIIIQKTNSIGMRNFLIPSFPYSIISRAYKQYMMFIFNIFIITYHTFINGQKIEKVTLCSKR